MMEPGQLYRGYLINRTLKSLTTNKKTLRKLTAIQRVACFYDLPILNEPWLDFPIKRIRKVKFIPPQEKLLDFTFQRWKVTDAKFTKYLCLCHEKAHEERIDTELQKFLACIYTHPVDGWDENLLQPYGQELFRLMPRWEQELTLETFAHIRNHIISRFPDLFPKPQEEEDTDHTPTYSGQLWQNMHYDIAETEAFTGVQDVANANMYVVLQYLQKIVIRNQNLKNNANTY